MCVEAPGEGFATFDAAFNTVTANVIAHVTKGVERPEKTPVTAVPQLTAIRHPHDAHRVTGRLEADLTVDDRCPSLTEKVRLVSGVNHVDGPGSEIVAIKSAFGLSVLLGE